MCRGPVVCRLLTRIACCQPQPSYTLSPFTFHVLSPATMFWPYWMSNLLAEDWWTNAPPVSAKITSWVIGHDPLSDIVPGTRGLRAPQTPGITMVLPAKFNDKDIIKNHALANFLAS